MRGLERVRSGTVARRAVLAGLAAGGGVLIAVGGTLRRSILRHHGIELADRATTPAVGAVNEQGIRRAVLQAVPHVDIADTASLKGVDKSLKLTAAFFEDAKKQADAFVDDVLGWHSKYKLIRGQHEEFLASTFRKHFFGPKELEQAIARTVCSYFSDLEAIDNQMLVNIRLDVEDLPAGATIRELAAPDLQRCYRTACGRLSQITGADGAMDVGRAAADTIVTSVVTMMAARLGSSAAVLGAGAASGWWTFGIGLAVGVIVDQIIATIWDWSYDPRGKLLAMIKIKMDEVRTLVVDGEAGKPGLRDELLRYAEKRATFRREAVMTLLADASGVN